MEEFLIQHYQLVSEKDRLARYTLRDLYPEWLEYKSLHVGAESYIPRINSDWKTYYLCDEIIDVPLQKLDKLTLDMWVHKIIRTMEPSPEMGL